RVILADERLEFGGGLLGIAPDAAAIGGVPATQWVAQRVRELQGMDEVTLLPRTTVTGYYHDNFLIACERAGERLGPHKDDTPKERLWKIRARRVVLASGAIERPLVFADGDRPGVMLAGALRAYIHRFGVLPGKRIVVLGNNDSAYHAALDAARAGAEVVIVDVRAAPGGEVVEEARAMRISILAGHALSAVDYARGRISGASAMALSEDGGAVRGDARAVPCDLIAVSGGWTPTLHLFSQARGKLAYCGARHCFVPAELANDAGDANDANNAHLPVCAGACGGSFRLEQSLAEGHAAGLAAAAALGFESAAAAPDLTATEPRHGAMRPLWILPCEHPIGAGPKKHFHELHNDATVADLALAVREGFDAVEHLKRYTTTGMGADQGKTSNLNALAALAELRGAPGDIGALGLTTFRPPYTPLSFGAIVGHERRDLFAQCRTTPMHAWHVRHAAVFEDVGDWKRPYYFPARHERMHDAVRRECLAARTAAVLLDASTLGKIDIRGADALKLLNMVYTNAWDNLAPGRCRYGIMLNEHGMVFDDGVTTRLGAQHFHMTTTTGGAARVLNHLEEWLQTEWPDCRAYCTSVTEQWAVASLSGPRSRAVLAGLCDAPLDSAAFPFMSMREMRVAGIPARVFRVSFTGELAFEINVPARFGLAVWRELMRAGEAHGICAYGTEAMHVLRAEKGFIIVGQDTDGSVTPADLGMNWLVSKTKGDFVGKRSLARSDTARAGRKQLVGLLSEDPSRPLPEGAHVIETSWLRRAPKKILGHVSSSYFSPNLGRSIALALVADGFRRKGEMLKIAVPQGGRRRARVTGAVFFDADGARARG
ncbi:MAG: sarcosine oxidase subunit alpha, partial [Gammaproteobacteria bacterium]